VDFLKYSLLFILQLNRRRSFKLKVTYTDYAVSVDLVTEPVNTIDALHAQIKTALENENGGTAGGGYGPLVALRVTFSGSADDSDGKGTELLALSALPALPHQCDLSVEAAPEEFSAPVEDTSFSGVPMISAADDAANLRDEQVLTSHVAMIPCHHTVL